MHASIFHFPFTSWTLFPREVFAFLIEMIRSMFNRLIIILQPISRSFRNFSLSNNSTIPHTFHSSSNNRYNTLTLPPSRTMLFNHSHASSSSKHAGKANNFFSSTDKTAHPSRGRSPRKHEGRRSDRVTTIVRITFANAWRQGNSRGEARYVPVRA